MQRELKYSLRLSQRGRLPRRHHQAASLYLNKDRFLG